MAGSEFSAHGFCLVRLRRLACDIIEPASAVPTLIRPLTVNEFLLMKRPQTASEILACIAVYYQKQNGPDFVLTRRIVEDSLQFSAFKIENISKALLEASNKLGFFLWQKTGKLDEFLLTEKGRQLVIQLPEISE